MPKRPSIPTVTASNATRSAADLAPKANKKVEKKEGGLMSPRANKEVMQSGDGEKLM